MSMKFKPAYCKICQSNVKAEKRTPSHVLHFLMSLITMGLWVIVWLCVAYDWSGWTCSTCGSGKISGPRRVRNQGG